MNTQALSTREKIVELAMSFPCLEHKFLDWKPHVWDAEKLDRQSASWSTGEIHCVRFILNVWNPNVRWKRGEFNLIDAFGCLDYDNRQPIINWANDPWWP